MLPFLPATAATLIFWKRGGEQKDETCFKKFWSHLPGFQIWTHLEKLRQGAKLRNEISKWQKRINKLKKEVETEEAMKEIEWIKRRIIKSQNEINRIKTDLQRFKIFAAVFESLPQFTLQCSILMKRIYANEVIEWGDPIFWLQTSSSIFSVFLMFTGLVCVMPILVHETERPPIRNLRYTYTKVLPLVVFAATPQLITLVAFWSFVTFEDWLFYIPYVIVYAGLFGASSMVIKYWMKKKYPIIQRNPSVSTLIDLGLMTSIICPSVIGVFDSVFLIVTSVTTTTIHSLALGGLCIFARIQPEWVFKSNLSHIQVHDVVTESQDEEQDSYNTLFWYLKWYTLILVPTLLLLSNCIACGIEKVFMSMNALYLAVWASDADRIEMVQDKPNLSYKLTDFVPGDEENNTLVHYCSQKKDEVSAYLLDNCKEVLDLTQTNKVDKTVLMVACDMAHPKTVESIFKRASEGYKIRVNDKSSTSNDHNTALHFAALSKGPIEAKKKIISFFWSYAKQLEINLLIHNRDGKTPIDILEESPEGKVWLEELGNPKEDWNTLITAINEEDFDQVLSIKSKFITNLNVALFFAIEVNEEIAIAMISNCKRLRLSMSETNEDNRTPLILACGLKKPKISKAILCQAKAQDIAINAKDVNGRTAFICACEKGLADIVAMMLKMAQEVKIDLNAKDYREMTGFIYACRYKHSEVIGLIMANAESLQIDLNSKDCDGKSGFDYSLNISNK